MKGKPSISSVQYSPGPVPSTLAAEVQQYLRDELARIAAVIQLLAAGHVDVSYAPPAKPRWGDIRLADGVLWNPGSGPGLYFFNSDGVWSWIAS